MLRAQVPARTCDEYDVALRSPSSEGGDVLPTELQEEAEGAASMTVISNHQCGKHDAVPTTDTARSDNCLRVDV